ncbi:hypothetical protein E3N88_32349 [Mikania micrantha]|uniref:Uncharacterized protein n=1 Tax=Mikania micrantha TaxID=192012 RepID=A0A5N6M8A1_9ASTR|nr:hypothetical protein E3N88_32349 [Mikania micrantha]
MVDADWKPSMGFIHCELEKAKNEIKKALNDNKSAFDPIMDIISNKSSNRLNACLHLTAYILNPYYFYINPEVRDDIKANDVVADFEEFGVEGFGSIEEEGFFMGGDEFAVFSIDEGGF